MKSQNNLFSKNISNFVILVGSLRTACRDRGVLCDLVKVLLDQPSAWNLEIAVEGTQSANLLAQSKHKNHLGVASKVIKFVLTQFNEIIREHNDRSTMNVCYI